MKDIAVLGYAARLPGAETIDDIWKILVEGTSTIGEIPQDRWSDARFLGASEPEPGHSYTQSAGVLSNPFSFDAEYFRISHREAEQMDPQQRILLETTARAFDHAGVDPNALDSTRTGVYVGAAAADHSTTITQSPELIGPHFMLGNTLSILSNRLSYTWDFQGPSMTVDTACSSSLVALDLARAAIERGEIDTAVVAGVNLLLSPYSFIGFSQARMVSQRGKCAPFSAQADGYVRSEGAVVFILQNRFQAELSKLNVRGILVGTAVNSDGKTNGLPLPSSVRQSELMQSVVDMFNVDPEALAFVEAHGTGTPIGDPREAAAIGAAYGKNREVPLPVGSAKAHFGHLEPAAGLVGLLKAQLCLERSFLPAVPDATTPNPEIDFKALNLNLPVVAQDLPARENGWCAAINSFGFGGTNAHAVLCQATPKTATSTAFPPSLLLTASSPESLSRLVETWAVLVETRDPQTLSSMIVSANLRIARHAYRVCLKAGAPELLKDSLSKWQENKAKPLRAAGRDLPVAFVFSGNGTAWAGMARDVYAGSSAFKARFKEAAAAFADLGCNDLEARLFDPELDAFLDRADVAQPLIFSIQVAMAEALADSGIRPNATLGHSVGECAAAVVAGRLSLAEAARIIFSRSRAFEPLRDSGEMAALTCSVEDAENLISDTGLPIDISAENSPRNVTVSGSADAIGQFLKMARKRRISGLRLAIKYPYHSRAVDHVDAALAKDLGDVEHTPSDTHFYSGWTGACADEVPLDAEYWRRNAREKVSFRHAVEAMDADGMGLFLEISPRSVLLGNLRETLATSGRSHAILDTLTKSAGPDTMPEAIARRVLASGGKANELAILGPKTAQIEPVPDYPFNREVFKLQPRSGFAAKATDTSDHPLLGRGLGNVGPAWTGNASLSRLPWLSDHKIGGSVLLPASAMIDIFRAAAAEVTSDDMFELRNVEFLKPIVLDKGTIRLHMSYDEESKLLTLHQQKEGSAERSACATLRTGVPNLTDTYCIDANRPMEQFYGELADAGLSYGPAFARLTAFGVHTTGMDFVLSDRSETSLAEEFACRVDALFHGAALLADAPALRVPYRIDRVRFQSGGPIVGGRLVPSNDGLLGGIAVSATDASGKVLVRMDGLAFARLPATKKPARLIYDEARISLTNSSTGIEKILKEITINASDDVSDIDVARGALAGRLAWDICFDEGERETQRGQIASAWLEEIEIALNGSEGLVARGACPWPSVDSLLQLLSERLRFASDELAAGLLAASSGAPSDRKSLTRTRDFAAEILSRLDGPPLRILFAGDFDRRLIANARALGHYPTVTAADLDFALAQLDDIENLDFAIHPLASLANAQPFDLVIGLSTLGLDNAKLKPIVECARQAGEYLLIDERPDIFALLTHRYESRTRIYAALQRYGSSMAYAAPGDSAVMIHHREQGDAPARAESWPVRVVGTGALAEKIAASQPDAAVATRLIFPPEKARPENLFELMRDAAKEAKDAETTWIIATNQELTGLLFSMRRVLCNEFGADLRMAIIASDTPPEVVVDALRSTKEHEIILSNDRMETVRILPETIEPLSQPLSRRRLIPAEGLGHRSAPIWVTEPRVAPGHGDIEIAVEATGLNFRDVMLARGILPDDAFLGGYAGRNLGIECAGYVTRAGFRDSRVTGKGACSK